jgi:nucleoside-diphosphate-sugar epimerase
MTFFAGPTVRSSDRVLVTGAAGFIGAKVVQLLIERGFSDVVCFVRPSSGLARLQRVIDDCPPQRRPRLVRGDLLSRDDCVRATEGVCVIYHLAAGQDKSFAGAFMNSALATRNLIEAFLTHGRPGRFVNVSSFAVYSNLTLKRGALLDESAPIEDAPQERHDAYGFGKLKQEELVRDYGRSHALPYVVLRPGTVYGPGKKDLTGRIGIDTFGFFIHVGGGNVLPLTFVDNCADAIVLAGLVPGIEGEVFNVVDDEPVTSTQFLRAYSRRVGRFFSLRLPYPIASAICRGWEWYSVRSQGQLPPAFNRRRCAADWKGNRYSNAKLRARLGWAPKVGREAAMAAFLSQFPSKGSAA